MYIFSELLAVVAEIYTIHLFLLGNFVKKPCSWGCWIFAYGLFAVSVTLLSFIPSISFLRLAFTAISLVFLSHFLFEARLSQAIYASLSFCCLYVLTDVLIIFAFSVMHTDTQSIMSHGIARAVCITVSHTLLLVLTLIVLTITKRKRSAITLPFLLALSPGCAAGVALGLFFCRTVQTTGEDLPASFLIAAVGLLYLNILIVFYAEQIHESNQHQHQLEIAEHHYAMQEQYYAQLREEQNETRAMFHDINKYLQAMRALVGDANTDAASQMLNDANNLFKNLNNVVDVGNPVISVILNEYKENAEDHDIAFDFDVSVPKNLGITAVDAYVILGNTLDNAIEACSALPVDQRYIHLVLKLFHDVLFYQIENPYTEECHRQKAGKNHGYGLQNVRRCVEKRQGSMTISKENGKFVLSLRLNIASEFKVPPT